MRNKTYQPVTRGQISSRRFRNLAVTAGLLLGFSVVVRYLDDNLYRSAWFSGYCLAGAVVILAAFHWRKKMPVLAVLGSAAVWMQIHIYLGLSTFVLFGWHIHWRVPQGGLEQVLAVVFLAVGLSGVYGLYLTRTTPRRLALLSRQFIYEEIPIQQSDVRRRAQAIALTEGSGNEILARVYVNRIAGFLAGARSWWFALWPSGAACRRLVGELVALDRYLAPEQREASRQLMSLVREKDDLDYHEALQGRLKVWMFLHIGLTYSLLTLMIVHVVLVHAFAEGWR